MQAQPSSSDMGGAPSAIMIDLEPIVMAPVAQAEQTGVDAADSVASETPPAPDALEPVDAVERPAPVDPASVEPVRELAEAEPVDPIEPLSPVETSTALPAVQDTIDRVAAEPAEEVEAEIAEALEDQVDPVDLMIAEALDNAEIPLPTARPALPRQPQRTEAPRPRQQQARQRDRTAQARPREQRAAPSRDAVRAQVRAPDSLRAAEPQTSRGGNSVSPARWQSRVVAHLERRKRYPAEARRARQQGTVQVRFSIDGAGNVGAVAVVGSSGVAALDAEVLALVRRASPIPAPPPGVSSTLIVPVSFTLR